jgi:hypothetical protein
MSLLQIVSDVCLEVGVAVPVTAASNPDPTIQQIILLAMRSGNDFRDRWNWLAMKQQTPATFTGDGTTTLFTFPASGQLFWSLQPSMTFTSSVYPATPLIGPINEDDLLLLKALPFNTQPSVWRRVFSNQIEFFPALGAGEIVSYVYASTLWIQSAGAVAQARWLADTDVSIIPEDLITLATVWRWKRAQGLDYAEEMRTAESTFDIYASAENTERVISMSRNIVTTDSYWPASITDNTDHNI